MTEPTPRTWPKNAYPTPEQLAAWVAVCTDEERLKFCEVALHDSQMAATCFMQNHVGRLAEKQSA